MSDKTFPVRYGFVPQMGGEAGSGLLFIVPGNGGPGLSAALTPAEARELLIAVYGIVLDGLTPEVARGVQRIFSELAASSEVKQASLSVVAGSEALH